MRESEARNSERREARDSFHCCRSIFAFDMCAGVSDLHTDGHCWVVASDGLICASPSFSKLSSLWTCSPTLRRWSSCFFTYHLNLLRARDAASLGLDACSVAHDDWLSGILIFLSPPSSVFFCLDQSRGQAFRHATRPSCIAAGAHCCSKIMDG